MAFLSEKLISASGGVQEETDDDFNLVTGLYHFDGSNAAQNNTFLDSSSNGFTVTKTGTIPQGTFSPFSADDGKWSAFFAAVNPHINYLQVASSSDFAFGTGDYTIEAWVWKISTGQQSIYDGRGGTNTNRIVLYVNSANKLANYINADVKGAATSDFPLNQWVHVALVRSGTTGYMFQNGTQVATWSGDSTDIAAPDTAGLYIGEDTRSSASYPWGGFISNLRVLKGTALYTGSYTTPTSPLTAITNTKLLTCCSNRHRDKSTSAHVVNSVNAVTNKNGPAIQPFSPFAPSSSYNAATKGGSGYFDNDTYLTIADNSNLDISSAFTAEAWIYVVDFPDGNLGATGQGFVLTRWVASGNQRSWGIFLGNDGAIAAYVSTNGGGTYTGTATSSSGVIKAESWHHVAQAWDGSTNRMLVDGVVVASTSASTVNTAPNAPFTINALNTSLTGANQLVYISGARFVNNSALYTGSYTIPTAPPTAVSGTQALVNFTNAAMFDQTGKTNVETVGNAQLDTSYKKFGTASAEFDGTGDRLVISNYDVAPVGTQSFTVECFIYVGDVSNYRCVYSAGFGIQIYVWTDSKLQSYIGNSSGGYDINGFQSTSTISINTWTHIALVRDSANSTLTYYINGTASGQTSVTTNIPKLTGASDYSYVIGSYSNGNYSFSGYIDEMRITNKARYTSNFTAPTKEFPNR